MSDQAAHCACIAQERAQSRIQCQGFVLTCVQWWGATLEKPVEDDYDADGRQRHMLRCVALGVTAPPHLQCIACLLQEWQKVAHMCAPQDASIPPIPPH